MANLVNGYDLNTVDQEELDHSKDYLIDLKPDLRGFSSDATTNMTSGNAWIQQLWNGDVVNIHNRVDNPEDDKFQKCLEGIPVGSDTFAIPVNAKHPGTAMKFIDSCSSPRTRPRTSNYVGYPMPYRRRRGGVRRTRQGRPELEVTTDDLENGEEFANLESRAACPGTGPGRRSRRLAERGALLQSVRCCPAAASGCSALHRPRRDRARGLARHDGRPRRLRSTASTGRTTGTPSTRCTRRSCCARSGTRSRPSPSASLIGYPIAYYIARFGGRWKNGDDRGGRTALPRQVPRPDLRLGGDPRRRGPRQRPPADVATSAS